MTLPSNTQLHIDPSAFAPKVDRATLRKRLFSPRTAPRKSEEAIEPVQTRIFLTAPVERVWSRQHDSHMAAYYEWKGNEPLGWLKMRCREMDIPYEVMVGESKPRWLVGPRHMLVLEIKERYPSLSNPRICKMFNRDHTLINAIMKKAPPTATGLTAKRELDDKIERMAKRGFSQVSIAQVLSIPVKTVNRIFFQRKLHPEKGPSCDDHADEIHAMLKSGMSQRAICLELGHSKSSMSLFIKRKGWTR